VEGFNPLCGDEVTVYLDVQDGILHDIKLTGHGCSISQSSSSLMSAAVKGKPLADVRATIETFKELMMAHGTNLDEEELTRPTCERWANSRPWLAWSSFRCALSAPPSPGTPAAGSPGNR